MQRQSSSSTLEDLSTSQTAVSPVEAIQQWLIAQLSEQLSLEADSIKANEPLTRYGLDSIDAVTLVGDLEDWLDLELPETLFWDHPSLEKSSQFLVDNYDIAEALAGAAKGDSSTANEAAPVASGDKKWGNLWGKISGS